MTPTKKLVREFLDDISDEKLTNLGGTEHKIAIDMAGGYRLDYQGANKNSKEAPYVHRLYIQPVGSNKIGSKPKRGREGQDNKSFLARCHASDEATPQQIRDALVESYENSKTLADKSTRRPVGYAPPVIDKKT